MASALDAQNAKVFPGSVGEQNKEVVKLQDNFF